MAKMIPFSSESFFSHMWKFNKSENNGFIMVKCVKCNVEFAINVKVNDIDKSPLNSINIDILFYSFFSKVTDTSCNETIMNDILE